MDERALTGTPHPKSFFFPIYLSYLFLAVLGLLASCGAGAALPCGPVGFPLQRLLFLRSSGPRHMGPVGSAPDSRAVSVVVLQGL